MTIHDTAAESGRSRGREIALNLGAIAGLFCVLAAAASFLFGIKPLIFRSGSMSPDIPTGALALSKTTPAGDLEVGDVVSVENEKGTRITHRVYEIVSSDGSTSVLILKGDANQDADITPYTVTEADRVFFSVPGLGYAVSWLSSPAAIFLGGALVGGVMVLAFGPGSKRKDDDSDADSDASQGLPGSHEAIEVEPVPHARSGAEAPTEQLSAPRFSLRRIPARSAIALGAVGLTALVGTTAGTSAAFTDSANAASSFASRSTLVPAPKYLGCSGGGSGVTLSWEHLGPGYTYQVQAINIWGGLGAPSIPANKGGTVTLYVSAYDNVYKTAAASYFEIRSVRDGVTGTSWVGERTWAFTLWNIKCDGAHTGGSDQTQSLTSGDGGATAAMARGAAASSETTTPVTTTTAPQTTTTTTAQLTSSTTTAAASTTTTTTTTAPQSTTTSATTTTNPTTTASGESTTAETTATTTTTTTTVQRPAGAQESPSGTYVAGKSGMSAVVQDSSGEVVFSRAVSEDATVQWDSSDDTLWIVDNQTLYRVTAGAWSAVLVDPTSGTIPAQIAALIK